MTRLTTTMIALYVCLVVIANVTASKLVPFAGSYVPAAVFIFAGTFTLLDGINRYAGVQAARLAIWIGLAANIILVLYTKLAVALPSAPFYADQQAFETVLGNTWRIAGASWMAFLVSERFDAEFFHLWETRVGGPLWLQSLLSNVFSTGIDSMIFIWVAFGGTGVPAWDLVWGQYKAKMIISTAVIPVIYGIRLVPPDLSLRWPLRQQPATIPTED